MATLPTVPSFSAGSPSVATLNQLSQAVSFVADMDVRPFWHLYKTATQSITLNTWTSLTFGSIAYDDDNAQDGTGVTVVTQGYYSLTGCAQFRCTTTAVEVSCAFLMTGGGSNPHLGTGVTNRFGYRGDQTQNNTASADTAICATDTTPFPCYPGDTLRFQVYSGANITLNNNTAVSYEQGRFVPNFTGYLVRTGT